MRILLVEDEKRMASFIERGLKEERYAVDVAPTAQQGLFLADVNPYDLIILDVMLPDQNGVSLCRELRGKRVATPVLMLTAMDSVKDKVKGLDAGADDYLTKPFAFEEFLARIRALLRKDRFRKTTLLKVDDLELDQVSHKVKRAGREIVLANKEYALLEYLMVHADEVVTRTMIAEHVWNEDFDSLTNVFDVYIHRLRTKIDKDFARPLIHSVRGVGYVLKGQVS
jgi:heavy metal response regulator